MNTHTPRNRLVSAVITGISVSLLVAGLARADNSAVPITPAPAANVDLTPVQADSPNIPPDYNTYLLTQGRDVYAQLQIARHAALNHNQAGFINALGQAREALDKDASTYNLGVFPLTKVKEDLDSASAAADNNTPYWPGALEAVQSALATFHWYGQVPSHGLLAAYTDAVNAYTLASSPNFLPEQRQDVLNQLGKAAEELQKSPGTAELVTETRRLIDKVMPENHAIKLLLQHIQQQINDQRQQSEDQYLQNIAADVVNNP